MAKPLNTHQLTSMVSEGNHFASWRYSNVPLVYMNGVYVFERKLIGRMLRKDIIAAGREDEWSPAAVESVSRTLVYDSPEIPDEFPPNILNLKNGILDLETMKMRKHTPDLGNARNLVEK